MLQKGAGGVCWNDHRNDDGVPSGTGPWIIETNIYSSRHTRSIDSLTRVTNFLFLGSKVTNRDCN